MFFILDNLFWIGLAIVGLNTFISHSFLRPDKYKPAIGKRINLLYIIGFFISIYGWGMVAMDFNFQHSWYETIGYIVIGVMISGAILEGRKDFPLVSTRAVKPLKLLALRNEEAYYQLYLTAEEKGLATALSEHSIVLDGINRLDGFSRVPRKRRGFSTTNEKEFHLHGAIQAVNFAKGKSFRDVMSSSLPDVYKTIAFQFLAEEQLKIAADSSVIDYTSGANLELGLMVFYSALGEGNEYEIYPLISDDPKCGEYYFNGRIDVQKRVFETLQNKIGLAEISEIKTKYFENYPNCKAVPVAHLL